MEEIKVIANQTFSQERALYNTQNAIVENCRFEGEEDGESFLKESENIIVRNCFMDLRYPMWHVDNITLTDCKMTANCRAALWYDKNVRIENCLLCGIKALRECEDIILKDVIADSPEFAWRCKEIKVFGGKINSEYAFFESKDIQVKDLNFTGKYSFQYTENLNIANSRLNTKDAFWHARNVKVEDSELNGEYIGWYSDGLTLINCRIKGTQPFCYCKNLRLINCVMEDCDLAFEYSDVDADVLGEILSVKNPKSGKIVADGYGEIILSSSKYPSKAQIIKR